MRARDQLVWRAHLAEVAAQEDTEREVRDRPIKEAERQLKNNHAKLIAIQRENILKLKDDGIFVSPELREATMSQADAAAFNVRAANKFVAECPFYAPYRTDENGKLLVEYFLRNGIHIFDETMLRIAFVKLRDLGALIEKPAAPEPEPEPTPEQTPTAEPTLIQGWDLDSGEPRQYTQRELDRMSSTDYRKALRLYKDSFVLPTRGPGPVAHG